MCKASGGDEAASCGQGADRSRNRNDRFRDSRPRLRPMGPSRRGRAVTPYHPLEPGRQVSDVGPGSTAVGRQETLRTLVPCGFDRPHGRLSALLFVDEKVSGIPLQVMGRMKARARKWLAENKGLRKKILNELG